jgi:catalase
LFGNIARHMQAGNTSRDIQLRQICHFFRADPAYGMGVARALGISLENFVPETAENGNRIGVSAEGPVGANW